MKNYTKQLNELRTLVKPELKNNLLTIKDLKEGSFFSYKEDLYKVSGMGTYEEKDGSKWFELECYNINLDTRVYFEWEEDDEVEISMTTKELKMRDLNKSADQIEDISEEEEGFVSAFGKSYEYDDDYGAKWSKGDKSYKVYFYDFIHGNEMLTVEEWKVAKGEYDYKVYLSVEVYPEDIKVVSV